MELISQDFRDLAAVLRAAEKMRVSAQNRYFGLTEFPRRKDWGLHLSPALPAVMIVQGVMEHALAAEKELEESLTDLFTQSPLFSWSVQYKGMGKGKLLARFLGVIGDPYMRSTAGGEICDPYPRTFPQLKALCGRSVQPGKQGKGEMPRHSAGSQSAFNDQARTRLWLIADQFVKQHTEPFFKTFTAEAHRYRGEQYRGADAKGKPWTDERLDVVARKRARALVGVEFLRELYDESKRLHEA